MTVRIAMWSGPRNISTAMMRAWEHRPDCAVVDEPFYAEYLQRTGLDHPARDAVIASQPTSVDEVVARLLGPAPDGAAVFYSKQMAQHLAPGADRAWTLGLRNVVLIREPREVVASYVKSRDTCEPADIGLLQQAELVAFWDDHGVDVPIIDSADFLRDPAAHLRWLCGWLGIAFTDAMLSWPTGPRASDGVWAPHWYEAVWASTGFAPWRPREVDLDPHDAAVAEACRPAYDSLASRRLRLDHGRADRR